MGLIEKVSDLLNDANDGLANFPTTLDVRQNDVSGEYAKEFGIAIGQKQALEKVVKLIEDEAAPKLKKKPGPKKGSRKNV